MTPSLPSLLLLMLMLARCQLSRHVPSSPLISCLQRNRLIGIAERDLVVTVERLPATSVTLTCHYCGQKGGGGPRRWYWSPDLWGVDAAGTEVDAVTTMHGVTMGGNERPRYSLSGDHSLTIHSLDVNDTGLYYCYDAAHSADAHKFVYAVDMLFPQAVEPVQGHTKADLERFVSKTINTTVNDLLRPHRRFSHVQLYLHWGPWSACHACRDQSGRMWRQGVLRVRHAQLTPLNADSSLGGRQSALAFKNGLAARSTHIFLHEKQLSLMLRQLPDYVHSVNCSSPRACRRRLSHRNSRAQKSFLARLGPRAGRHFSHAVYEHDAAILECPSPALRSIGARLRSLAARSAPGRWLGVEAAKRPAQRDVDWYFHSHRLNKSALFESSGHRLRVARDGRLMIGAVRRSDQGRYSCAENGIVLAIVQLRIKPTYQLLESRTSLRFLAVGALFNAVVFVVVMVVLWRQRRVQRLLAGARWRHELRQQRRERQHRKKQLVLNAGRHLKADANTAVKADELMKVMEDVISSPQSSSESVDEESSRSSSREMLVEIDESQEDEDGGSTGQDSSPEENEQ